jgi:hypothetical protein
MSRTVWLGANFSGRIGVVEEVFEVVGGGPVGVGGDARLVAWGGFGSEYASAVVPEGERPRSMRSDAVVWR